MRPYVVVWALLALGAATYVALAQVRPDLVQIRLGGDRGLSPPETNQGQRAMTKALAEVDSLRQGLNQVQLDVAKLKTESQQRDEDGKQIAARVSVLEQSGAAKVAAAAAPTAAVPAKPVAKPAEKVAGDRPLAVLDPEQLKVLNAASPKVDGKLSEKPALETGSIAPAASAAQAAAAAPPVFGAPVVTPAAKPAAVQIASGASLDALRLSWGLLSEKHGDALRKLEPRYVAGGSAEQPEFDLLAGPIKSPADAKKLCKALQAKGVPCKVGDFGGDAL